MDIAPQGRLLKNRIGWLVAWPGLPALWLRGDVRGLFWAGLFALGVNAAVIDTLVWPELFEFGSPLVVWLVVGIAWIVGFLLAIRHESGMDPDQRSEDCDGDALFIQAQTEYLSGNWDEAGWLLERRLSQAPRDVEARLLLATLHRHQRRFEAAEVELRTLKKLDESLRWTREIENEIKLARQFQAFERSEPGSAATAPDRTEPSQSNEVGPDFVRTDLSEPGWQASDATQSRRAA